MSKEIINKAKEYLKAELSVIPTKADKLPALAWKTYQSQRITEDQVENLFSGSNIKGLAIICGSISGNLEVIDVDCKYDITGLLFEDLTSTIEDNLPGILSKLVIVETINKGYHIYYRCKEISGNSEIAKRYTTLEERQEKYKKEIAAGKTPEEAKRVSNNDKIRVLIETRGEGGYVIAPPFEGYKYITGDPRNISTISPEERAILWNIASSFNEIIEPESKEKREAKSSLKEKYGDIETSLEDYDNRGDALKLLYSYGWTKVKTIGERVYLLRPGETKTKSSGNYHIGKKCLVVFSSSTEFNAKKPYSPTEIYNLLECGGDWSKTALDLGKKGYGGYKPEYQKAKEIKTDLVSIEIKEKKKDSVAKIIQPGETLKTEEIQRETIKEVVINSPGVEAREEVLKTIETIQKEGKRIYVKEGDEEMREYRYQLQAIFNKYGNIQYEKGGLTDRDTYSLLDEVVILSNKLEPIDKDIFKKEFLGLEPIKELGISEESLSRTLDRIASTREKEAQEKQFKNLLSEATILQDKGEVGKALDLIESKIKEVKLKDKATEFSSLLLPTSEDKIKKAEETKPKDLETGYTISGEDFLLPGGAITVYAGATGHGKTILSINTALNVAQRYPDKKFIFFTYEERDTAIIQYFLNTYIDKELNNSTSPKSNRRLIKDYFKTGSTQYIARENIAYFESKKAEFFRDYIETGRILVKYVDFNSQELDLAIRYLHKTEPNIGGVFIDYFQLLNLPGEIKRAERINSRQEELKQICQQLNRVATATGLPLILGAQFNRDVTDLTKLHPTKIGEAGDIERIVNTLVGLWDVSKNIVSKDTSKGEEGEIKKRTNGADKGMYIELLKSRELQTGIYELLDYNGKTGKIKNREERSFR